MRTIAITLIVLLLSVLPVHACNQVMQQVSCAPVQQQQVLVQHSFVQPQLNVLAVPVVQQQVLFAQPAFTGVSVNNRFSSINVGVGGTSFGQRQFIGGGVGSTTIRQGGLRGLLFGSVTRIR